MITPEQCRAARNWLDWTQDDLANRANVSLSTVRDFEKERRTPIQNNLDAIQKALESAGVSLTFDGETLGISASPRIKERDLTIPALLTLNKTEDGSLKVSELISILELMFHPSGEDADILENRADTKFSQIVRNLVSHRASATNIVGAGYATYDKASKTLTITESGREKLKEAIAPAA